MTAEPPILSPGYGEFEIDIPAVFRQQLPQILDAIPGAPLTLKNVTALPEKAQGGYILMLGGKRVYVGKTDAQAGFRSRLRRHWCNVQHRIGLDPKDITFKAVRILVFHNFDVEDILIKRFSEIDGLPLSWNNSGFGNNDPGHRRESQNVAQFDLQHPVDIDRHLDVEVGKKSVLETLIQLKDELPYLLRYETDPSPTQTNKYKMVHYTKGHIDQRECDVILPRSSMTVREIMSNIVEALPSGWLCTVFPDRVILYKDSTRYANARYTIP